MAGAVGVKMARDEHGLAAVEELRTTNARVVSATVGRAALLLPAWSHKHGGVTPPAWLLEWSAEEITAEFGARGLLDFRPLSQTDVIAWLARIGRWATDLPDSLELDRLGLSEEDVAAQRQDEERQRWDRAQARRSISLDGHPVALDPDRVDELIRTVQAGTTESLLRTSGKTASLQTIEQRRKTKPQVKQPPKPARRPPTRMTGDQTELIGFMGELVAHAWLERQYGADSSIWRSRNRRFALIDGDPGDDSLGFDFEVLRPGRRPLMFEVKSTTTDDLAFEMSEAEITLAQDNGGNDRYRILFVGQVNDSSDRWIAVLPNPLSGAGRGQYRPVGRGFRYEFKLTEPGLA